MREIKFRFYDKKTKKLVEECDMWWNYADFLNFDEVIVCQYTGLKDKNGKEIYEGDVVELTHMSGNTRHIIEFNRGKFHVSDMEDEDLTQSLEVWGAEVIGNIYENRELLEREIS